MKHIMLLIVMIAACALGVTGCAGTAPMASSEQHITRPEIGTVQTKEVGEPLFEMITARTYDGLTFPPGTRIHDAVQFTVEPTGPFVLAAQMGTSDAKYCGPARAVRNVWGDLDFPIPDYCVTAGTLRDQGTVFTHAPVTRVDADNFQRQLLYEGKVGNELRLSYREFRGDLARPAFSQELTFDLGSGNIVGVKGARLEVLDVNNLGIRYRVLQPFGK